MQGCTGTTTRFATQNYLLEWAIDPKPVFLLPVQSIIQMYNWQVFSYQQKVIMEKYYFKDFFLPANNIIGKYH